ncbi:MAG: InlB B-repeat-containing protein, partial [Christensenellales bacterium]
PSSKAVKLGDNYGDLPTPTRVGYTFNGWQNSDGSVVTSTTQNTTIGNHTLTASWTAKTYSVSKGANLTGVTVTVNSSGTFGSGLSISTTAGATGYNYTFTNIKVYSGTSTSGTLLATYTSTSATYTMTGTYYSSIYVYATWTRSAIPTTISASATSVSYTSSGSITVTAGGGGGKWTYSVVSATKSYTVPDNWVASSTGSTPSSCVTLSNTSQTTGAITVTCSGEKGRISVDPSFIDGDSGVTIRPKDMSITYIYVIRATSAYNGTTADITISFTRTV